MAFTEFCCRSGGSNLNAGTRTGNSTEPGTAADLTYASGNWVASTGVFTVASGNPSSDGVAVGDFASVYADGSTVTGFVGRVTARDTTTITVSLTAKAGTAPTDGTGNRTLKIGGAWQGPNGTVGFPLNTLGTTFSALTNTAGDPPRINMRGTFSITASINPSAVQSYATVQGYTSTYGDGGRATIDGGNGAGFNLWANSITDWVIKDMIFSATFSSGTGGGFIVSGGGIGRNTLYRCVATGLRGIGFQSSSNSTQFFECEAYTCTIGFRLAHGAGLDACFNCIAHDNSDVGFLIVTGTSAMLKNCIADSNTSHGIHLSGNPPCTIENCDCYNNGGDGLRVATASGTFLSVRNCNFIKNGGYGINAPTTSQHRAFFRNCGFGSGTQANTSGTINNTVNSVSDGHVNYANDVTPWVDPANGDFRITLSTAKGAGRGTFLQTASSYSGTVGYPDIGAAQHQDSGGGGARMVNIRGGADQ